MSKKDDNRDNKNGHVSEDGDREGKELFKTKNSRKHGRRSKRHNEKNMLNDVVRGNIDPDEFMDYIDS